eukprot:5647124-Prymnesium_polylepis.1
MSVLSTGSIEVPRVPGVHDASPASAQLRLGVRSVASAPRRPTPQTPVLQPSPVRSRSAPGPVTHQVSQPVLAPTLGNSLVRAQPHRTGLSLTPLAPRGDSAHVGQETRAEHISHTAPHTPLSTHGRAHARPVQ